MALCTVIATDGRLLTANGAVSRVGGGNYQTGDDLTLPNAKWISVPYNWTFPSGVVFTHELGGIISVRAGAAIDTALNGQTGVTGNTGGTATSEDGGSQGAGIADFSPATKANAASNVLTFAAGSTHIHNGLVEGAQGGAGGNSGPGGQGGTGFNDESDPENIINNTGGQGGTGQNGQHAGNAATTYVVYEPGALYSGTTGSWAMGRSGAGGTTGSTGPIGSEPNPGTGGDPGVAGHGGLGGVIKFQTPANATVYLQANISASLNDGDNNDGGNGFTFAGGSIKCGASDVEDALCHMKMTTTTDGDTTSTVMDWSGVTLWAYGSCNISNINLANGAYAISETTGAWSICGWPADLRVLGGHGLRYNGMTCQNPTVITSWPEPAGPSSFGSIQEGGSLLTDDNVLIVGQGDGDGNPLTRPLIGSLVRV